LSTAGFKRFALEKKAMAHPWNFADMQVSQDYWRVIRQVLKGKDAIIEDQPE